MEQNLNTAAQELRHGNANFTASTKSTGDMVKALSAPMLFDYMAIVMDKQALADRDFTMNVILPDVGERTDDQRDLPRTLPHMRGKV